MKATWRGEVSSFADQLESLRKAQDSVERSRILWVCQNRDDEVRNDRKLISYPQYPEIDGRRVLRADMVITEPYFRGFLNSIKAGGAAYLLWKSEYGNFGDKHTLAQETPLDEDGMYPCGIRVESVQTDDGEIYPDKSILDGSSYYSGGAADPDGLLLTEHQLGQLDFMAINYDFFGAQQWASWWAWMFWRANAGLVWPDKAKALTEEGMAFLVDHDVDCH